MSFDYRRRIERLQGLMSDEGVDLTLLAVGADLLYFIGYEGSQSERLTALVIPVSGQPVLYVPELEAPRVVVDAFEVVPWSETQDPVELATRRWVPSQVAASDGLWSAFLMRFQAHWPHVRWSAASGLTRHLRMRKDTEEIELLRRAARGVDRVMSRIPSEVRFAGRREIDVARDLAALTVEEGHQSAEFAIVASGEHGASPHHEPGERTIDEGDLVVCDFGGRWRGYHSDSTRTCVVGEPTNEQLDVHAVVMAANEAGRRAVSPGAPCQEVDRATRQVIDEAGLGERFIHRTGHGIGLEVHEHPYLVEGNEETLESRMTFSIEPGVYLPDRFGVRIEDIVVCRADGAESLNESPRELMRCH